MIIEAEYEEVDDGVDELDLSADASLPWLESDEDEVDAGGIDAKQIIGLLVILLALLAVIVGAVWYLTNRGSEGTLEPDGSTIAAPEGPVREAPANPGGKEFAGTGNVAPVVGEGGTREGVMNTDAPDAGAAAGSDAGPDAGDASKTGGATAATSTPKPTPTPTPTPTPAQAAPTSAPLNGVAVQLAAYSSRARAQQGWADLSGRTSVLSGVRHRIVQGEVDIGTVYRLQAVAGNLAAAERMCAALKADGLDCQVKR